MSVTVSSISFLLAFLAAVASTGPVRAQTATVPVLSLVSAKQAAVAAREVALANQWSVAIAIVDAAGRLMYFERLEGTQPASVDIAIGKARTAAEFRRSTKVFEDAIAEGRLTLMALDIVPFEGGLPIIVDGYVVGAIGISGATPAQDGVIAAAGVRALE
jgi:glc operon protein GlcG